MQNVEPALLAPLRSLRAWLASDARYATLAHECEALLARSPAGQTWLLAGPTGERNSYSLLPRRRVLCIAPTDRTLLAQLALVLAAGSRASWRRSDASQALAATLPLDVRARIEIGDEDVAFDAVLVAGSHDEIARIAQTFAQRPGPIVGLQSRVHDEAPPLDGFVVERLLVERSLSINTAAAGGNASLMSVG
jgi:RHH-type proline utilization regulon transcriptional repressor/proline dehydrogenase/delta 1-pyrroline-5-carboxylate dehydrogenase